MKHSPLRQGVRLEPFGYRGGRAPKAQMRLSFGHWLAKPHRQNLDEQRLGDETAVFWAVVASEIFRYSETFAKELDQTFCSSSGSKERVVAPGSTEGIQQMAAPTEEVMQFVLVEKHSFLEYVPNTTDLRRCYSMPMLSSPVASEHTREERLNQEVPKLIRVPVRDEHSIRCKEADPASPGAESVPASRTAWKLARTRVGSDRSLSTTLVGETTQGGSSWDLEVDTSSESTETTSPTSASPRSVSSSSSGRPRTLQPSESVGSSLHEAKLCKPCAWYWRPGSCTRGADCLHCHLCVDGELAKRRFENRKLAKLRKKQNKAAADHA